MSGIWDFIVTLIAKLFGVVLDKFKKPETPPPAQPPPPVVIINVVRGGESGVSNVVESETSVIKGVIPIVLPSDTKPTEENKSEKFDEDYWEALAVDLTKKVRPRDRLILRDKRYTEPEQ